MILDETEIRVRLKKPKECNDCESCKEYFFLEVNNNLRKQFLVE